MTGETDPRLLRMHGDDNILVLAEKIECGAEILIGGSHVVFSETLPIAHKVAARDIGAGDSIVKYGAPIGRATADIARGTHVHVQNVESAYTPSYVLPEDDA